MGASEAESGTVKIKDLETREENTLSLSELAGFFK
jgi:histidyl-tRNA synthetase